MIWHAAPTMREWRPGFSKEHKEWKSTESKSVLWNLDSWKMCSPVPFCHLMPPMTVISDSLVFYFDFRDISKQHWRNLIPFLLIQLSSHSSPCCNILSQLYMRHDDNGMWQPNEDTLTWCWWDRTGKCEWIEARWSSHSGQEIQAWAIGEIGRASSKHVVRFWEQQQNDISVSSRVSYSGSKYCPNVWLFWKDELTINQEHYIKWWK
jgi:hypothetical protein